MKTNQTRSTGLRGRMTAAFSFLCWAAFTAALFSLAIVTAAGFFGRVDYRLDLLSHFRVQYALGAGVMLVVAYVGGQRRLLWLTAAVFGTNLLVLLPFLALTPTAEAGSDSLRIVSANVYYHNNMPEEVLAFITETDPDIVFLTEMTRSHRQAMAKLWDSYPYVVDNQQNNIMLSRIPIESWFIEYNPWGRPDIAVRLTWEEHSFTVIGIHPSTPMTHNRWQQRNSHLQHIASLVKEEQQPVIVTGDFNVSSYSPNFTAMLDTGGLINGRNGQGINATWPNFKPLLRIPIDHLVATPEVTVHKLEAGRYVGSDHRPLVVDFSFD